MAKTVLVSNSNSLTNFKNRDIEDINLQDKIHQEPQYDYYNPKDIYRKKIFGKLNSFDISYNPFIDASSHLFKYVNNMKQKLDNENNFDVHEIKQEFIAKISLFDERAINIGINNNEMLVARYILCTVIDEFMSNTTLGENNTWSHSSLLKTFHKETYGGENFFFLLEKFLKSPAKYIHILELMYICLSLGFKGRYRLSNHTEIELNNMQDSLFRQIKIIKGREPDTFYTLHNTSHNKFKIFNHIPYSVIIVSVSILFLLVYMILTIFLNQSNNDFLNLIENVHTLNIYKGGFNENNV